MPDIRKRKPRPYYTVFVLRYATSEDRGKLSKGDIPAFTSSIVHSGTSEAMALRTFGRACIQQTNDPLAYSVTLQRDREVIADVKPVPKL